MSAINYEISGWALCFSLYIIFFINHYKVVRIILYKQGWEVLMLITPR